MSITLLKGIPKLAKKGWKKRKPGASPEWIKMRKNLSFVGALRPLKRKTLTISGPTKPKHREVIIKKPSKTKLSDTWQDRRIQAMNRKLKKTRGRSTADYAQEASDIYKSKAPSKKVYKSIQKKFHGLTLDQKANVYEKRAKRDPKSFHFDKKKFGKKFEKAVTKKGFVDPFKGKK